MARFPHGFRTVRWKLTLSATVTMLAAVAVMTIVIVVQLSMADQRLLRQSSLREPLEISASSMALQLRPLLGGPSAETEARRWLASRTRLCNLGAMAEVVTPQGEVRQVLIPLTRVAITDATGSILAATSSPTASNDGFLLEHVPDAAKPAVRTALGGQVSGSADASDGRAGDADRAVAVAAPVVGAKGEVLGAVYLEANTAPLDTTALAARVAQLLPETMIRAAPIAIVVAFLLGLFSTRGLARRFRRLSRASDAWARGDFSLRVEDPSGDELGTLSRSLDDMALQLSTLLEAREALAVFEERNALARELHDTVKQKVFSVSMLLASADALWSSDPARARTALVEARQAAQDTGRELSALIDQQRTDLLQDHGLVAALREHVRTWSRMHGIPATVDVTGGARLPERAEMNLLRVAQEALTNVARHSRASRVQVRLQSRSVADSLARVQLSVADDGIGFETAAKSAGGFGLVSMCERLESMGGRLGVESVPQRGTTIVAECTVPLHRGSDEGRNRDEAA